jgi:CheY-like chemotaxis protein
MNAKILVVEDDPEQMRMLVHALRAGGFEVVQAFGGEDAIRKAKTQQPDLVLTDLAMPKVSGVEVIEKIKADLDTMHIPIIAVTAHIWDRIATSAGSVGCDGFLSKPFSVQQLLREVYKHLKPPEPPQ